MQISITNRRNSESEIVVRARIYARITLQNLPDLRPRPRSSFIYADRRYGGARAGARICRSLTTGGILRPVKKPLIIVESPTKARTIKKFLPARYIVKASVGHVRDLPKSSLGVDVEHDFAPKYLTIKGKGDVIKDLKSAVKSASDVYLATDPDREGEAIAWHLAELLKLDEPKRIELHEITKDAAHAALKDAHPIDIERVTATQASSIIYRLA